MVAQELPSLELPRRYVDMPAQTSFLESVCHNHAFRAHSVFVPVSAAGAPGAAGLYEVDLRTDAVTKICALDPAHDYFGSKITNEGRCFICVGGCGQVLSVDLRSPSPRAQVLCELPGSYHANDLAIDTRGGRLLMACNDELYSLESTRGQILNTLRITAIGGGAVFSVPLSGGTPTELIGGFRVLAGSVYVAERHTLWLSELNNLIRMPLDQPGAWTRVSSFDPRLFADNMDASEDTLLFPFYREGSRAQTFVMRSALIARLGYALGRLLPERMFGEPATPGQAADRFDHVCFAIHSRASKQTHCHRLDLSADGFDGHCTAVERVGHQLVFINYLERRLLIVDASSLFAN